MYLENWRHCLKVFFFICVLVFVVLFYLYIGYWVRLNRIGLINVSLIWFSITCFRFITQTSYFALHVIRFIYFCLVFDRRCFTLRLLLPLSRFQAYSDNVFIRLSWYRLRNSLALFRGGSRLSRDCSIHYKIYQPVLQLFFWLLTSTGRSVSNSFQWSWLIWCL